MLGRLLPALSTRDDWERVIGVVDGATELIYYPGARLQVDEARLLRRTVTSYLHGVAAMGRPGSGDQGSGAGWEMFRLAAADREVLIYTRFWLGLTSSFEHADTVRLGCCLLPVARCGGAARKTPNFFRFPRARARLLSTTATPRSRHRKEGSAQCSS